MADPQPRTATVVPDVSGLEAAFDYLVPDELASQIRLGTIVRVALNGRRVRAWVIDPDSTPPPGLRLQPILKVTGFGPSQELIDLASWASWRWAGKRSFFLQTASPLRAIRSLPNALAHRSASAETRGTQWFAHSNAVLRWPPASDPLPVALAADDLGAALIITPSQRGAERLAQRMRDSGRRVALMPDQWPQARAGGTTVIGTRAAAWAPMPELAAVVVLDAHDDALQSEASPTWSAIDVVAERARRRNVPFLAVTATPRSELLAGRSLVTLSRDEERNGWAPLSVVDLRHSDPRSGFYSTTLVNLLRSNQRVVCVLNRKGRAQLLICSSCDEIARCELCEGALAHEDEGLICKRCRTRQPNICRHCGSTTFKQFRPGVSKVREELEVLAQRPVGEVTGSNTELPDAEIIVGTEAVLHRVGRAHAVVFLDFDQELMGTRYRTLENALVLLGRASRIVGGHRHGGIVVVQSRQPGHEVIEAAVHGDPERLTSVELPRREQMAWPPFVALATVSGAGAGDFIGDLPTSIEVLGPLEDQYLLRADDATTLADAIAATPRPVAKTRVEIDPVRI